MSAYDRYHIETSSAPDAHPHPSRFRVRVKGHRLIGLLLRELVEYRANLPVVLSRPCVYGVFSGPLGGLKPREHLCVGCLRCTTQYPDIVQIQPNPERTALDSLGLTADQVDTILYEARSGRVPVRGAGYRGPFGGQGWDGMWTDMSEIVRPTRDGIHGREFISTVTEIGEKPMRLAFERSNGRPGALVGGEPRVLTIQVPFLFDIPPRSARVTPVLDALTDAAARIDSLAIVPVSYAARLPESPHVVPLVGPADGGSLERLPWTPRLLFLDGWDARAHERMALRFPQAIVGVRVPADTDVVSLVRSGVRVLHLAGDTVIRPGAPFFGDQVAAAHRALVDAGIREEATLIGSGGVVAAEHVPKALLLGLDAVALDVALLVALQARFESRGPGGEGPAVWLPRLEPEWAVQRIVNLSGAWRDQLLEIMGAMGLREVRRLRGETGRCMFQRELEREAFAGIDGYPG